MSNNVINNEPVHGYKVFNPDWTCRDFQYEVGKHLKKMLNRVAVVEGFIFAKKLLTVLTITLLIQKTKLQK